MRYIWNMGLSGSILTLIYLCGKRFLFGRLEPKWRCRVLQGILLYYLVPLTFLKEYYDRLWRQEWFFNSAFLRDDILGGIWVAAGAVAFLLIFRNYLREKRKISIFGDMACAQPDEAFFEEIRKAKGGVGRVRYLDSSLADGEGKIAFTVGILHPIIFYPACRAKGERELIVEHEFTHIRHGDLLWQMLAYAACILHCVNPLVWYLKGELAQAAELYCDEAVLREKDSGTGLAYAQLLLDMADSGSRRKWGMALSRKSRKLKERLEGITKRKKVFGRKISAVLVILPFLLNAMTVLAYPGAQMRTGDYYVAEKGTSALEDELFDREILYNFQFTDAEGNIAPVLETESRTEGGAARCHQYVEGHADKHTRNRNGKCDVIIYKAARCRICGNVTLDEQRGIFQWAVCTHEVNR